MSCFDKMKISESESYREHLNQYDVLKINMQNFLSATSSMDEMLEMLQKYLIFDLLDKYETSVRFRDEKNLIQSMKDVYTKTGHPFVILIDEWDKTAEGAIEQIKQKQYMDSLKEYHGELLLAGINYDKKTKEHTCVIEKYELA